MLRVGRLTDYGIILMSYMAMHSECVHNAAEVASATNLRQPTVSKLMRLLARRGLLASQRGAKGGYRLARMPEEISLAEVIRALEGPVSMTLCTADGGEDCEHEPVCPVRPRWQSINVAILRALDGVTLSDMSSPGRTAPLRAAISNELRSAVGEHGTR